MSNVCNTISTETNQGEKMRIYKRETNGLKVSVYNDSNIDWVVEDKRELGGVYRYAVSSFTMKRAVEFHGEIFGGVKWR